MNIREIENSIIAKLKQNFPEVLVEGFPDKPSEFILLHPVGALLVHYQGSNYFQSNAISFISQENKKEFSIIVVTRNLRGNEGAYTAYQAFLIVFCTHYLLHLWKILHLYQLYID